jgi:hypothetical protein
MINLSNIQRRAFLKRTFASGLAGGLAGLLPPAARAASTDFRKDWLARWQKSIVGDSRNRYCDREMGEEIGWLVSPFLNGYYYGYLATHDSQWIDRLVDWGDAWTRRGVKEPDGYTGWPKADGASTSVMPGLFTDNILGEAMALRPMILMAGLIWAAPPLKA